MKVMNFGSMNIDKVYRVKHLASPGETISALSFETVCGGKGLNQSIAIARAGQPVTHVGKIGPDGEMLLSALRGNGVDTSLISEEGSVSGHAIIQVDKAGQNSIIIHGGANHEITLPQVEQAIKSLEKGDILVLQNEINLLSEIIERASTKGVRILLNPSPIDGQIKSELITRTEWLILNEIEGCALCGEKDIRHIPEALVEKFPSQAIILILGKIGVVYRKGLQHYTHGVYDISVVDTTAAGDTFCGYFIASVTQGFSIPKSLEFASKAASIAVSRTGASVSIPYFSEILESRFSPVLSTVSG